MYSIPDRIKQARIEAGYTQQQFGELCGYEKNAQGIVARWENGTRPLPIEKLRTVSKLLNIPLEDLIP